MAKYYVNDNPAKSGDYEVHKFGCSWLAKLFSITYLGNFSGCKEAVAKAKKDYYVNSNGCEYCSPQCHK